MSAFAPARTARSLTCHYLRPPGAGDLRVDVIVERSGRSLSTVSARLSHDGALCVIAVGAFAVDFRGALDYAGEPPAMPGGVLLAHSRQLALLVDGGR